MKKTLRLTLLTAIIFSVLISFGFAKDKKYLGLPFILGKTGYKETIKYLQKNKIGYRKTVEQGTNAPALIIASNKFKSIQVLKKYGLPENLTLFYTIKKHKNKHLLCEIDFALRPVPPKKANRLLSILKRKYTLVNNSGNAFNSEYVFKDKKNNSYIMLSATMLSQGYYIKLVYFKKKLIQENYNYAKELKRKKEMKRKKKKDKTTDIL